jgi:hypothetical protein
MRHRVVLVGPFYNTTPNQVHLNNGWNIITRDHLGISGTTVVSVCVLRERWFYSIPPLAVYSHTELTRFTVKKEDKAKKNF